MPIQLNRRRFPLALATLAAPLAQSAPLERDALKRFPGRVSLAGGAQAPGIRLDRRWAGDYCRAKLTNRGKTPVAVKEVVLFSIPLGLPPETPIYGESFQMLSQTSGTLGKPADLSYSEAKHYRIPQPEGVTSLFGMVLFSPPGEAHALFGFTSCHRFIGRFFLQPNQLEVVVDTEGRVLNPGESWDLEEFLFFRHRDRSELLDSLAERIAVNHPPLKLGTPPAGWCSWYCFGPRVTAANVLDNLDQIAKQFPQLKYVQVDDGYQPAMGDWLGAGKAFGGDLKGVLKEIRNRGFEPAIWVAPFIAEADSEVFRQHPDWFIRDGEGKPLRSDKVTFGGWRRGPWYGLDGTNPAAREHLEMIFRTMRQEWGCTYFKLDANFWGATHGGFFHDPKATRIEAYRRGMEAILRGAGGSFILGCNHPIWPSFGLIHGSRSSGDISRKWATIRKVARENLSRNWQNGKLWWNDPDAVVLDGDLPENEFQFHATAVFASGGMILSGDDLTRIPLERAAMLKKLLPPVGKAAKFTDDSLQVGFTEFRGGVFASVFNWGDEAVRVRVRLPFISTVSDFWTGKKLGPQSGFVIEAMPARSARLYVCKQSG